MFHSAPAKLITFTPLIAATRWRDLAGRAAILRTHEDARALAAARRRAAARGLSLPRGDGHEFRLGDDRGAGARPAQHVVRPLLVLLTLPVTLLTLGLFLFVINALMFWAAARVLDGFNVTRLRRGAGRLADLQPVRHGHRRRDRAAVRAR